MKGGSDGEESCGGSQEVWLVVARRDCGSCEEDCGGSGEATTSTYVEILLEVRLVCKPDNRRPDGLRRGYLLEDRNNILKAKYILEKGQ